MRIQISREELTKAVQVVQGVVSIKSTLPILSNILLETMDGKLRLVTTDLEIGISCTVPVDVIEPGAITVPAKKFNDLVKELPNSTVIISTMKNDAVTINCEKSYFKLFGLPKDDFPKLPEIKEEESVELDQSSLKKMINMTSFAVSHDHVRYVLNGVLFAIKENTLRLVAADGRRLALIEKEVQAPKGFYKEAIIPTKATQELNRLLHEEGQVRIKFGENQVVFQFDQVLIISRPVDGEFPNYQRVIPEEPTHKTKVATQELLKSTRRAGLYTNQDSESIKINLFKDKMVISKNSPELGEVKDEIGVEYKGEEMFVGFSAVYLIDALKNINQEEITLELNGPDKAGVIKTDERYLYLLLPMQLT